MLCQIVGKSEFLEPISASLQRFIKEREGMCEETEQSLTFGFDYLDGMMRMKEKTLSLVAGEAETGKTAFLAHVALHVAMRHKGRVAIFLAKCDRYLFLRRLLASLTDMTPYRKNGRCVEACQTYLKAAATLSNLDILISERSGGTIDDVLKEAKRAHRERPLSLIVVDDLSLMRAHHEIVEGYFEYVQMGDHNEAIPGELKKLKEGLEAMGVPALLSCWASGRKFRGHAQPSHEDVEVPPEAVSLFENIFILHREWLTNMWTSRKDRLDVLIARAGGGYLENVFEVGITGLGVLREIRGSLRPSRIALSKVPLELKPVKEINNSDNPIEILLERGSVEEQKAKWLEENFPSAKKEGEEHYELLPERAGETSRYFEVDLIVTAEGERRSLCFEVIGRAK